MKIVLAGTFGDNVTFYLFIFLDHVHTPQVRPAKICMRKIAQNTFWHNKNVPFGRFRDMFVHLTCV